MLKAERNMTLAFAYARLSREEAEKESKSESSESIKNQLSIIRDYCDRNGITIVKEFYDDGYSGASFDRPQFQEMISMLETLPVGLVITKDLSRLGRDMTASSNYADTYFPSHGIRFLTVDLRFDSDKDNVFAPFEFAMNDVQLRATSSKVKTVLNNKRQNGQYCTCPPYGYKKDPKDKNRLIPDPETAPVVQKIFRLAAEGYSSLKIAETLNNGTDIPPLLYRSTCRDSFTEQGKARASRFWNYTTVKRVLKNEVYLGNTLLGKTKKINYKSNFKARVPRENWAITLGTHEPLVSKEQFEEAQKNLAKGTKDYRKYDHVRKSIFGGVAFCAQCGHAMCSSGTVHKGERVKYWQLSCIHQRKDVENPCPGTHIRYSDLVDLVKEELNELLTLTDEEIEAIVQSAIKEAGSDSRKQEKEAMIKKAFARIQIIDKMIPKMFENNALGYLSDQDLKKMCGELQEEKITLQSTIAEAESTGKEDDVRDRYEQFFALVKNATRIEELDADTVRTFIERIEIGPKVFENGLKAATHRNTPFKQDVRIYFRFIGEQKADFYEVNDCATI